MKIYKITLERLREILNHVEDNKNMSLEFRTYKINKKVNVFLQVYIKK